MTGISGWLDSLGLGHYAATFIENAIDIDILPDISEADLEKLGVTLGHRKRILKAVVALSDGSSPRSERSLEGDAAQLSDSEQRHLTVLFCDIVDSTKLAVELDAEQLSSVIRRFQGTCAALIVQGNGYVARFMGDGLLAYFGYPIANEDDAENAVRTGLDLVAKVNQLLLPSGDPMQLRVSIASGLVVVEAINGTAHEKAALGETPNLAARLQSLGEPNSVLVAESTRKLLGEDFVCKQLGSFELKGFPERIPVSRVTGERAIGSRFEAKRSKTLTQFVGRQNEMQQLLNLWSKAKGAEGQVALLCGEPGIGKSRVIMTFFDQIKAHPHITIRNQCSPNHMRSPFYPIIQQLSHAANFVQNDTPEIKLSKLEKLLSQAGPESVSRVGLFASLLSIPKAGSDPISELSPKRRKDLTISALNQQLVNHAGLQPVLLVFEDVHWIDPTTLELLTSTINSIQTVPVFLLITFRPEFFPPWLDQSHVKILRLERLERIQVGAMIADLSRGKEIPTEVLNQIVTRTDGVPLFVEELTKAVLESGQLETSGDRHVTPQSLPAIAVPMSLYDSLMARLDRLAPVKEIAQIGAVIGREFSYRLLAELATISGASLDAALLHLAAAGLIFSRGEPPESTYTFKHALVQDTAYSSLMPRRRKQFHNRIGTILKEQFHDVVETQPELIAYHLEQAGLIEPAIEFIRKAGQRAIERSANAEAIGHLKHGLALLKLLPASERQKELVFGLEVVLTQAMIAARGYAEAETKEALLRAKVLLSESTEPAQKFTVLYGLWACYYVAGEIDTQRKAASEFLTEAERHGGSAALSIASRAMGTTCISIGQFDAARQHLEKARALYDAEQHASLRYQYGQDIGATALCYLSWALWHLGCVDQASKVADEASRHAEKLGHPFTLAYTLAHARGMMDVFRRHPDDARIYAREIISTCTEHGFPFWAAGGQILDGWAIGCEGRGKIGLEILSKGLEAWRSTGARLWLPIFICLQAEALSSVGDDQAALQTINKAINVSQETGETWAKAELLRVKARILRALRAKFEEIETLLTESIRIARHQRARCWELRSACDLAQLWREQRREGEALKLVRSIYDQFTEGFDTTELIGASSLINDLETRVASSKRDTKRKRRAKAARPRQRPKKARQRGPHSYH